MRLIECYDVGGTNIRGALIESCEDFKVIASISTRTIKGDPNRFIEQIEEISISLRNSISQQADIIGVSLGVPGPVENGVLLESPPMDLNLKIDIPHKLGKFLREPIFVDNDMNVATIAELKLGSGRTIENFYLLTLSTGIGAGIVLDGNIINGSCGEFGHNILERDPEKANKCSCGRVGCWVAMASGYAIESTLKNKVESCKTTEDLFKKYYQGEEKAKMIIDMIRDYNAHGIGNMLNAFSVDSIVIMGSVGVYQFEAIIPTPEEIKKYTINKVPKIRPTNLGGDIGLLGAYMLACEKLNLE